jgi:glycerol-1-phosphate dehydrogenase [NAD(P)+]
MTTIKNDSSLANTSIHVQIGDRTLASLIEYCLDHQLDRFMLVADQNTYPILGQAVEEALTGKGWDVKTVILTGDEIGPDEHFIVQVLVKADTEPRTYLAVGSGTITDITRFVSHRTRASFISVPTAPSVDGYTSIGAPLVVAGLKQTVICQPPVAVFADLATLCEAPTSMIASGFGDMIGKFTSLADWQLGHLLWNEPYSDQIAQRVRQAVEACAAQAKEIGTASRPDIRSLMDGLIESGLGMLAAGSSRPASGMEHHLSHHLEMKLIWEQRPAVLHGAKVGVTSLIAARYYEGVRRLTQQQVTERLAKAVLPDREAEIRRIRAVYAPIAEQLLIAQAPFLDMDEQAFDQLKRKIIDRWPQIQEIAATVPASQELAGLLQQVGAATEMQTLGIGAEEVDLAVDNSHYLRDRFTVAKLARIIGIPS